MPTLYAACHRILWLALAGLFAVSCSESGPLTSVSFRVLGPPGLLLDGTCPETSTTQPPLFTGVQPETVRITYMQAGAGGTDELLCDVVVPYAGMSDPIVAVPADSGTVTMAVEFFSADNQLLAAGVTRGIELGAGGTVDIRAQPSLRFSCADDRMQVPRAFHTATKLPDGKVLLIGGAVANAVDGTDQVDLAAGLFASGAIELYDPKEGRFTELSVPGGLAPRVMHETHIVDTAADGKVTLALMGGLTVSGDPLLAPVLVANVDGMRLGLGPMTTGAPVELLVYDPATSNVTPMPVGGEQAPVLPFASYTSADSAGTAPLMRVGGLVRQIDPATGALYVDGSADMGVLDRASWQPGSTGLMNTGRLGATVSDLGNGSVLVWGGHIGVQAAEQVLRAGEVVTGLEAGGMPTSTALTFEDSSDAATPRAFHKAVAIGPGELLIIGGFDLLNRTANLPAGVYAQNLELAGATVSVRNVGLGNGGTATPAAYMGASLLETGDVLTTGGNPAVGAAGCAATDTGQVCSVDEAFVYRKDLGYFDSTAGRMLVSRYGHGQTLLDDGTVLITGGLHAAVAGLELVRDAEVFAAWGLYGDTLAPALTRMPAQVATAAAGAPVRQCELIESSAPAQ